MAGKQRAIDVGRKMADLLKEWRPKIRGSDADVASAVMHALERYSIELEGPSESGLRVCLFSLSEKIDERIKSI